MNDKQQLAAMGEHTREMGEFTQKKHNQTQVMAWAGDYEKTGGYGLIVEMLKSYAELLNSSQFKREFIVPDGWKLVPIEPTEEMRRAAMNLHNDTMIYQAMLDAAPEYKP
jgi:hypothetical protein